MQHRKIVLVGSGGHAAELVDYIESANEKSSPIQFEILGLLDDAKTNYDRYSFAYPYLGTIKEHEVLEDVDYLMGIANMKYRKPIIVDLKSKGAKFASFIHPTAIISRTAEWGEGCVISHNVSLGPKVKLGDFNLINSRCTIGHDTQIGSYNFLSPQVVTGGMSRLGNENFLGTNAAILPMVKVGNCNVISAGMIVEKNVEDDATVFHRFKEKIIAVK